ALPPAARGRAPSHARRVGAPHRAPRQPGELGGLPGRGLRRLGDARRAQRARAIRAVRIGARRRSVTAMLSLSPPAARSAAVLLAAAAASLLFLGAVKPLLDAHRQLDARLEALEAEGALLRRAAAGRAEAERRLEARRARGAARGHYLAGRTPALAAAELQKLLRAAAGQGHGELVSTEVVGPAGFLESPSQSGLSRQDQNRKSNQGSRSHEITVRARVRGDTATLQRLLPALEAGPPILFVRDLTVDVARSLVIGVEVGGYMDSTVESIQRKSVAFTGGSPQSLAEGKLFFPPLEHFAEIV